MAKKSKQTAEAKAPEPAPEKPKVHEAIEAYKFVLDAIPRGKIAGVIQDAGFVEHWLRTGLRAIRLLEGVRDYILDIGDKKVQLGGEESPFVKEIDKLLPREEKDGK